MAEPGNVPQLRVLRGSGRAPYGKREPVRIGARVRAARQAKGWSLARTSAETGIPQSTLAKFETDSLMLPIDRFFTLSDALELPVAEMFQPEKDWIGEGARGRRSITRAGEGKEVVTATYSRRWLFHDLTQKRMFPLIQKILVRDIDEFGPLLRHAGEEFTMVLQGRVNVITDIYEPIQLDLMDAIYIDSGMGHAYLNAGEGEALVLNVSMSIHEQEGGE